MAVVKTTMRGADSCRRPPINRSLVLIGVLLFVNSPLLLSCESEEAGPQSIDLDASVDLEDTADGSGHSEVVDLDTADDNDLHEVDSQSSCESCTAQNRECDPAAPEQCGDCLNGYIERDGDCLQSNCSPGDCGVHGTCDMNADPPTCNCEPGFVSTEVDFCQPAMVTNTWTEIVPLEGGVTFWQGSTWASESTPCHPVTFEYGYALQTYEVSWAEYELCVAAAACAPIRGCADAESLDPTQLSRPDHPVRCVSKNSAKQYCEWIGARLPSESEWELAAHGPGATCPSGRWYPWGSDQIDGTLANYDGAEHPFASTTPPYYDQHGGPTTPVGFFNGTTWTRAEAGWIGGPETFTTQDGRSPYGVADMAGNVAEWVADCWHDSYDGLPPTDGSAWLTDGDCSRSVKKGEAFSDTADALVTFFRGPKAGAHHPTYLGFRCAVDLGTP